MYVVKVGDYYVKDINGVKDEITNEIYYINTIMLSKEIMKSYDKDIAEQLAVRVGGKIIEIPEEVTNDIYE